MSRACKVERMIADNPVEELKRLEDAIGSLRESVDEMLASSANST